jgi:glutathione S-transferase
MLTLFDYPASENAWKVRQLLHHLQRPYVTVNVSIFEGEGRSPEYQRISPTGTVPAIQLDDGRVLSESNAILFFLATDTPYLPTDVFARAKVQQWLSFEQERVESQIGSLRYWTLTGKLDRRPPFLVQMKRGSGERALQILNRELSLKYALASRDKQLGSKLTIATPTHPSQVRCASSTPRYPKRRACSG